MFFVKADTSFFSNFLDFRFSEVALCVLDEQAERYEGEENDGDSKFYFYLLLIFARSIKVEVHSFLCKSRVPTRAERDNPLTFA